MSEIKKVLVTGATGFVGNYVINELLQANVKVIATSSNEKKAAAFSWFNSVKYIPFNLNNFQNNINYFELFGQPDTMIHLAWEGLPNYKSAFHVEINLPRHKSFLNNMIVGGLRDLNVIGTCLEYGLQEGCLSEDQMVEPITNYAIAKNELRKFLETLKVIKPFTLKWIRLFYMYGKGQHSNSLLAQLEQAINKGEDNFNMSGGEQVRDYLPVEKVAENIVRISLQNTIAGIVNCSSGIPVTLKSFVEEYLNKKASNIHLNLGYYPYPDYEPMRFWGDNKRLRSILSVKTT